MKKASNYRVALPLVAVAIAAIAFALTAGKSSATGRELNGSFCPNVMFCIDLQFGDTEAIGPNPAPIALRPGTYTLSVSDNSGVHNFALRSCEGADTACTSSGDLTVLTPICNSNNSSTPCGGLNPVIDNTVKLLLKHGTYRLFCQTGGTGPLGHEAKGMFVDISVGGVGQVG